MDVGHRCLNSEVVMSSHDELLTCFHNTDTHTRSREGEIERKGYGREEKEGEKRKKMKY